MQLKLSRKYLFLTIVIIVAVGIGVFTFLQTTSRHNLYDMDSRRVKNEEHQSNLTLEREHPIAKIILRKRKSSGYFTNFLNFTAIIFNCYPEIAREGLIAGCKAT